MTVIEVRTAVQGAISGLLGLYRRPDGSTIPALWVGAVLPAGYAVTGLECIIEKSPNSTPLTTLTSVAMQRQWVVRLRAWNGGSIGPALDALAAAFHPTQPPTRISETDDMPEQGVFYLPELIGL